MRCKDGLILSKKMKKSTQVVAVATSAITVLSSLPTGAFAQGDTTVASTVPTSTVASVTDSDAPKTRINRVPAKNLAEAQATLDEAKDFSAAAQAGVKGAQRIYNSAVAEAKAKAAKADSADKAVDAADKAGEAAVKELKDAANKQFSESSAAAEKSKKAVE